MKGDKKMNTIFCVMGKSSSGKDCLAKSLTKKGKITYIIPYTTRPMRPEESDGDPYFFLSEKDYQTEDIICNTCFETVGGKWFFGFKRLTHEELDSDIPFIAVVSPKQFNMLVDIYAGLINIIGLYIEADEEERIVHAIMRERKKDIPDYKELCRRFISDREDFKHDNPDMIKMKTKNVSVISNDYQMTIDEIAAEIIYTFRDLIKRNKGEF